MGHGVTLGFPTTSSSFLGRGYDGHFWSLWPHVVSPAAGGASVMRTHEGRNTVYAVITDLPGWYNETGPSMFFLTIHRHNIIEFSAWKLEGVRTFKFRVALVFHEHEWSRRRKASKSLLFGSGAGRLISLLTLMVAGLRRTSHQGCILKRKLGSLTWSALFFNFFLFFFDKKKAD